MTCFCFGFCQLPLDLASQLAILLFCRYLSSLPGTSFRGASAFPAAVRRSCATFLSLSLGLPSFGLWWVSVSLSVDEFDDDEERVPPASKPVPPPSKAAPPPSKATPTKAAKPNSPVPFEARPPPGQSPVQLGAMRSPRAPPKIDVKPVHYSLRLE